jgi:hypothetical protein
VRLAYTYVLAGAAGAPEPPDNAVQAHLDMGTAAGWKLLHYTSNTRYDSAILHNFIWIADEEDRPAGSEGGQ